MSKDKTKSSPVSQMKLVMDFFKKNPNRNIEHPEIVDWATEEYRKRTGKIFRDPDRQIRSLHQRGFLQKIKNGVYRYDPQYAEKRELEDFTPALKKRILERDNYRCVFDGKGIKEGVTLHIDHIKPKELGGKATLENGQTICGQHNNLKKIFRQTETGKKAFIRLYELAKLEDNKELIKFCSEILEVFERNNINSHIVWKR